MSAISFAEVARGLHPYSSRRKAVAVLVAYLDEGGTHAQSPVVTIGGFVAPAALWDALEPEWQEKLDNLQVPYFHAAPCDAGDEPYQHLSRPLRDSLFAGLATVIAKHKPVAISVAIKRLAWETAKAAGKTPFEDPYHAVFEFAMQHLAQWAILELEGESVALMFAEHQQYKGQGSRIYETYSRSWWGKGFVSLAFGDPEKIIPLQAADLITYEKTRREVARLSNPKIPVRPALQIIADAEVQQIDFPHNRIISGEIIDALKHVEPKA